MGPQRSPKVPIVWPRMCACLCQTGPTPRTGRILGYVAQNQIRRARGPPANPHFFFGFQASELPNETPRPPYHWSLGGSGGQPGPRTGGPTMGPPGSLGRKKSFFSKSDPTPFGMLKQVILAHFESVVTRIGHGKSQNALKMDQKWVKRSQKRVFPNVILDRLGCSNKCF